MVNDIPLFSQRISDSGNVRTFPVELVRNFIKNGSDELLARNIARAGCISPARLPGSARVHMEGMHRGDKQLKIPIVAGVLLLALLSVPPAMAAISPPVEISVVGAIPDVSCSFTVTPASLSFGNNMIPGSNYDTPDGSVDVTCNYPWTITVSDASNPTPVNKPAGFLWNATGGVNLTQGFRLYKPAPSPFYLYAPVAFKSGNPGTFSYSFHFNQAIVGADIPHLYATTVTFTLGLT
jgi:hypothetical protein